MILLFISKRRRIAGTVAYNFPVLLRCCIFPALINQALHREGSLWQKKRIRDDKAAILHGKAKNFVGGKKHAGCRTCVPAPSPAAGVAVAIVNISRLLMRGQAIAVNSFRGDIIKRRNLYPHLQCPCQILPGAFFVARSTGKL